MLARRDTATVLQAIERHKVTGMSVFPAELEALLGRHPGIHGSAVVPITDTRRGQLPLAFVKPMPGEKLDAETLTTWARENMAVGLRGAAVRARRRALDDRHRQDQQGRTLDRVDRLAAQAAEGPTARPSGGIQEGLIGQLILPLGLLFRHTFPAASGRRCRERSFPRTGSSACARF